MITLGSLTGFRALFRDPCVGKRVFETFEGAQVEIDKHVARGTHRPQQGILHPYRCPRCQRVHMGHTWRLILPDANSGTISF